MTPDYIKVDVDCTPYVHVRWKFRCYGERNFMIMGIFASPEYDICGGLDIYSFKVGQRYDWSDGYEKLDQDTFCEMNWDFFSDSQQELLMLEGFDLTKLILTNRIFTVDECPDVEYTYDKRHDKRGYDGKQRIALAAIERGLRRGSRGSFGSP